MSRYLDGCGIVTSSLCDAEAPRVAHSLFSDSEVVLQDFSRPPFAWKRSTSRDAIARNIKTNLTWYICILCYVK